MMNRFSSLLVVSSIFATLPACSMFPDDGVFRDRDKDYLRTQPAKPLSMPEGIEQPSFQPLYPVPKVVALDEFGDAQSLREYEVPRPDTVTSDESVFGVKIQRLGESRWIFLSAPTSQVWPHVQSFLAEGNVNVVSSNAQTGLIETAWLQYSDDDSVMARYRMSLEKGLHPDSTEVHIIEYQQSVDGDPNAPEVWPTKSTSQEREEWMVKELAQHLAQTISNASASLLGQNIGGEVKASYVQGAAEPTLKLNVAQGRAWATITHSARQEGFVTWDLSEPLGLIFAGYNEDQTKERGFFRKAISLGRDGKLPEEVEHSLEDILSHLSGSAEVRSLFSSVEGVKFADALDDVEPGYLIVVNYESGAATIVIRDHRGRRPPVEEAKALLRILRKNLI